MPENVTPLTTEHLRSMRDDIAEFRAQMTQEFSELKQRFRVQEHHILGLKRDEVSTAEDITALRHQIDGLLDRLKRLEDRAAH